VAKYSVKGYRYIAVMYQKCKATKIINNDIYNNDLCKIDWLEN